MMLINAMLFEVFRGNGHGFNTNCMAMIIFANAVQLYRMEQQFMVLIDIIYDTISSWIKNHSKLSKKTRPNKKESTSAHKNHCSEYRWVICEMRHKMTLNM